MLEMTHGITGEHAGFACRMGGTLKSICIFNIEVPEGRARAIDKATVQKIYESLPIHGLIQPIGVRQNTLGLTLAYGEHRYRAWLQRYEEEVAAGDIEKGIWNQIPCIVYDSEGTDEDLRLLELNENLLRKELSVEERARNSAEVLGMITDKRTKNPKSTKGGKVPMVLFGPPSQKDVLSLLNTPKMTFQRQFKAYQKAAGIDVNWTKLNEEQYDGFVQWFRDEADRLAQEQQDKADGDEAANTAKAKAKADKDYHAWYDKGINLVHDYLELHPEKAKDVKHDLLELVSESGTLNQLFVE